MIYSELIDRGYTITKHNADVLAGRVGSETRTEKINNMLSVIDDAVEKAKERRGETDTPKRIRITSSYIATEMNYSRATINRNGFPQFFNQGYECVSYKRNNGLIIQIDEWIETRKEERKAVKELKASD